MVGEDIPGGNENGVSVHTLSTIREPEGVVECKRGLVVGEAVKVPVYLVIHY